MHKAAPQQPVGDHGGTGIPRQGLSDLQSGTLDDLVTMGGERVIEITV